MREREKTITIRIRNLSKDISVSEMCHFVKASISYLAKTGCLSDKSNHMFCCATECRIGMTCDACWKAEFDKFEKEGGPVL